MRVRTNQKIEHAITRVTAFDPGEATGVCVATLYRQPDGTVMVVWYTYTRDWPGDADTLFTDVDEDHFVICEDWRLRKSKAKSLINTVLSGDRCAGFIEGVCAMQKIPLVWQQPGQLYPPLVEAYKAKLGKAWPENEHEADALAHLLIWLGA